ncbi:hypothetical protein [Archangium primigenium]|uniref:hypothetical protein n=1 Tax=[Archangium] primigenium TaxID=2792470 RepID=UPI0019563AAC|nr:hypothetical protein [Archangium primigenium]MBM7116941.1 hypothetical protein [Archangium primigenium]
MVCAFTKTEGGRGIAARRGALLLTAAALLAGLPGQAFAQGVGVIPERAGACPRHSDYVSFYMDNEDSSPISSAGGWTGAITLENGFDTNMGFCRVDGSAFRGHPYADFAVLSLDTRCPEGSYRTSRFFDNEDTRNRNGRQGNIFPNSSGSDTLLYFCVFRATGVMLYQFPNFHLPYGVFSNIGTSSAIGEAVALATGVMFTDDEDSNNRDEGYVPNLIYGSDGIGLMGRNSYLKIAKLREDTLRLNCLHGGSLVGTNCKILAFQNSQVIPGINYWVSTDQRWPGVYYAQVNGGCPHGGTVAGYNCAVYSFSSGTLIPGVNYWVDTNPLAPGVYYAN